MQKYHFSGFQKRNQALSCILNQAKQLDCILGQKERDRSRTVSTDGMGGYANHVPINCSLFCS